MWTFKEKVRNTKKEILVRSLFLANKIKELCVVNDMYRVAWNCAGNIAFWKVHGFEMLELGRRAVV